MAGRFAGLFALFALGALGVDCSSSFDVCKCNTCSHPYGACPGEDPPAERLTPFVPVDGGSGDALSDG